MVTYLEMFSYSLVIVGIITAIGTWINRRK